MINRYSRKELTTIWSEENKYKIWLDVEIAAAQAMEKLGQIPKGVSSTVKKKARKLISGDILSLNAFPMISGYYTALERTLFLNKIDDDSLKAWEANVKVHKKGLELIKPGIKCSEICHELNDLFAQLGYLQYRTFGYGHSFGVLSHFYGRESGLELREDVDTILEPNMVISMEPMIMIPEGKLGAGGYREHDILVINENGAENITKFPFGPEHNIVKN